jgi:surface-anchored protein
VIHDDDNFISYPPDQTASYVAPALKDTQPADPSYDFIGAGAGNPVWILPQFQNPTALWLGTSSELTPSNAFDSYFESDPRIGFTAPWMKIRVVDVRGPGQVSMWQTDTFGAVTVWFATSDGIGTSDVFFSLPGSHVHYNFGFTMPGTYEVDLRASAYLQYPNDPTFSAVTTYTFCVDDIDNGDPPPLPLIPPDGLLTTTRAASSPLQFEGSARHDLAILRKQARYAEFREVQDKARNIEAGWPEDRTPRQPKSQPVRNFIRSVSPEPINLGFLV